MFFSNTIWLWAIAGIVVPLAIHLLSRDEGKTIFIGSIRHLTESPMPRFRHIRINELGLLALRSLLIVLFAMLLAEPWTKFEGGEQQRWLLLDTGIEKESRFASLIDTLVSQGFEARRLSTGFPKIAERTTHNGTYWQMIESLRQTSADSVVVLSYNLLTRFAGERVSLPAHVRWISTEPDSTGFVVWKEPSFEGTTWIRTGSSTPQSTTFETSRQTLPETASSFPVNICYGAEFQYDARIIRAALEAAQLVIPQKIEITQTRSEARTGNHRGWTIWLDTTTAPMPGDSLILFQPCRLEHIPLIVEQSRSTLACSARQPARWLLTRRLDPHVALESNLSITLANILLEGRTEHHVDLRHLNDSLAWSKSPGVSRNEAIKATSLEPWIIILLLLTLITERWLAFRRAQ